MHASVASRVLFCTLLAATASAQSVRSEFTVGTDGWLVANASYTGHIVLSGSSTSAPAWDSTLGQPAGSLRVGDVYGETAVRAPAAFLGDKLSCFGGALSWDIMIRQTDAVAYPAVWLVGATKTLVYDTASPPLDVWHSQSVPLVETGWRVNGWQGPAATRADMMAVLGDLRGILINTEWKTGPDDTNLDNVMLAPPSSGALCYGVGCLGSNGRVPTTWLSGTVAPGAGVALELTDGLPGALAVAVVGTGPANVPIFGCTAWIAPSPTTFVLALDGAGKASMPAIVPLVAPGPFATLQTVFFDAAAPNGSGLTFSNAVSVTVL